MPYVRLFFKFLGPVTTPRRGSSVLLLIPEHTANVAQGSSQEISSCVLRDQAGNPIFNVVSRHTRTGFGLIFDQSGILKISLQILSPATVPDAVTSDPRSNNRAWFLMGRIRVRCSPRPLDQGSVLVETKDYEVHLNNQKLSQKISKDMVDVLLI